jgi:hypothetical protein
VTDRKQKTDEPDGMASEIDATLELIRREEAANAIRVQRRAEAGNRSRQTWVRRSVPLIAVLIALAGLALYFSF